LGLFSRGRKRLVLFGLSRVVNLLFLYQIYLVTPSSTRYTVSAEGKDLFSLNLPVCMTTSVGGTAMLLVVNGITWFRMFTAYRRYNKNNSKGLLGWFWTFDERRSAHPRAASLIDTFFYINLMGGCQLILLPQILNFNADGDTAKTIVRIYCWLFLISLLLLFLERSTLAIPRIKSKLKSNGTKTKKKLSMNKN